MDDGELSRKETTYGHAEDGLVALVNFTLRHDEGCARNRCNNGKKRGDGEVSRRNTGDEKKKKEEKGRKGAAKNTCRTRVEAKTGD